MDPRFLHYYEHELRYVREHAAEFAQQFPKVAGRLGLSEHECADPHVERLIEAFGFMAARVHLKLDAEFPRFTQQLLELVYPHYLAPTPSMLVAQFVPNPRDSALKEGFVLARDTVLRTRSAARDQSACEYRTRHEVKLYPFEIESAQYTSVLSDIAELHVPSGVKVKALLRIVLRTHAGFGFDHMALSELPLFLRGADEISHGLYEQLVANSVAIMLRAGPSGRTTAHALPDARVHALGFADEDALLPYGPRSFQGYRLLHEYFAFPSRYAFVELRGLGPGVRRCGADRLELIVALSKFDPDLESGVDAARLVPFATPALNLFEHTCDRIVLSDRSHELHVVPDRTRPLDLEVHSILHVAGYVTRAEPEREFLPLYSSRAHASTTGRSACYTQQRRMRGRSSQRTGPRSHYVGSELFLTLVDGDHGPHDPALRQLAVKALCTNRDLPLLLALGQGGNDFSLQTAAPIEAVRCVAGPSVPRSSPIDGEVAWKLISQLSLNYLSISDSHVAHSAAPRSLRPANPSKLPLRDMLMLYAELGEPALRRQVEGLVGVASRAVTRPLPGPGGLSFGRGLEVALRCDERAFAGGSVFVFASVLARFIAKYASINSFTETVLSTQERGEVYRWPATVGLRHTL